MASGAKTYHYLRPSRLSSGFWAGQEYGTPCLARGPNRATPGATSGPAASRVLVVDRDPDARASLTLLLEAAGFSVRTAPGPDAACTALGEFLPAAVVVGMRPTDPAGFRLLARVADLPAECRPLVAVLTGRADDRVREELA